MEEDVRWKQRFQNFEKAFFQLRKFVAKEELNELEQQGLIQCFEYNFELSWILMKDYLTYQGIVGISGSRDAIRQAFSKELINDGVNWMKMVEDRIQSVHTHNEVTAQSIENNIYTIYYELFSAFYLKMQSLI